jgi:chlorite dismutase
MVLYSQHAQNDLNSIFTGLINWKKMTLNYDHVVDYHNTIVTICDNLDKSTYHAFCVYPLHKHYGQFVCQYRRNKNTTWYIIYDKDRFNNIYIQHIVSNHLTKEETNLLPAFD